MENLTYTLANLLVCCDRAATTYEEDAQVVIDGLTRAGYFIGKNEAPTNDIIDILAECLSEAAIKPEDNYQDEAKYILGELNTEGYKVVDKNASTLKWRDATNITLKDKWAIVVYKCYNVSDDTFYYHPRVIRSYNSEEDLVKGNQRAHKLCEIDYPV